MGKLDAFLKRHAMAFGAGAYWAMVLLQTTSANANRAASLSARTMAGMSPYFYYLIFLAAMAVAVAIARVLDDVRFQKGLAAIGVTSAALILVLLVAPIPAAWTGLSYVSLFVQALANACNVMFWGLCFTALEKHDAEKAAGEAALVALPIYLLCSAFVDDGVLEPLAEIVIILSITPYLFGVYENPLSKRDEPIPNKKLLVPFYGSRVFFGVCFGVVSFVCVMLQTQVEADADWASIAALVFLLAFNWSYTRHGSRELAPVRLSPIIVCGFVACPFLGSEDMGVALCCCCPAYIWVSWIILHSVQISAIKHRTGLDDATLSLSEKLVFMVAYVLTYFALNAASPFVEGLGIDEWAWVSVGLVVTFSAVVVSSYILNCVIDTKETERIVDNAFALNERRNEPVLAQIAADHGLTERELDVLRVLAKGYARSAICEELCISDGTARTHVTHIYQKLGVHSRNELLALAEEASRTYVAKERAE